MFCLIEIVDISKLLKLYDIHHMCLKKLKRGPKCRNKLLHCYSLLVNSTLACDLLKPPEEDLQSVNC